ncbi:MAG TPA: hypothetical protein VMU87_13260 [Stellaceae bacterium]|nr:hypothetical protein [Stellaceae bacterium]
MRAARPETGIVRRWGAPCRRRQGRLASWPAAAVLTLLAGTATAAPLLPALEPQAQRTEASVPASNSNIWSVLPRGEHMVERLSFTVPAQDGLALGTSALEAALLVDPAEESRQAVAQSLQESPLVRRILGSTFAIHEPDQMPQMQTATAVDPDIGRAVGGPGFADDGRALPSTGGPVAADATGAPRGAAQQRPPPEQMDNVSLVQDDGPTLRTVARSIVSVQRPNERRRPQTVTQSVATAADDVTGTNFSLGEQLLDSRVLGDALRTVVRPNAAYGLDNSFSIFGQGRFELQLDLSAGLGSINLTETSTGAALSIPLEDRVTDGEKPRPNTNPPEKFNLVETVLNFVTSATGVFAIVLGGCLFVLLAMFRVALTLRR